MDRDARAALDRWTAAGLVSAEQRTAIEAFESRGKPERRISLVTEALGYLGAILIISAFIAAFGRYLEDIGEWGRVAILAALTALFVWAGTVPFRSTEPALRRLTNVLWFVAVGLGATTVAGVAIEIADLDEDVTVVFIGAVAVLFSGALWRLRPSALQLIALTASAHLLVTGLVALAWEEPPMAAYTIAIGGLGAAWMALGRARTLEPGPVALVIGTADVLIAPGLSAGDHDAWVWVGVAVAAGCMAISVAIRSTPVLGLATVATFVYVTWVVVDFIGDALGLSVALLLAGVAILGIALLTTRLRRYTSA